LSHRMGEGRGEGERKNQLSSNLTWALATILPLLLWRREVGRGGRSPAFTHRFLIPFLRLLRLFVANSFFVPQPLTTYPIRWERPSMAMCCWHPGLSNSPRPCSRPPSPI